MHLHRGRKCRGKAERAPQAVSPQGPDEAWDALGAPSIRHGGFQKGKPIFSIRWNNKNMLIENVQSGLTSSLPCCIQVLHQRAVNSHNRKLQLGMFTHPKPRFIYLPEYIITYTDHCRCSARQADKMGKINFCTDFTNRKAINSCTKQ